MRVQHSSVIKWDHIFLVYYDFTTFSTQTAIPFTSNAVSFFKSFSITHVMEIHRFTTVSCKRMVKTIRPEVNSSISLHRRIIIRPRTGVRRYIYKIRVRVYHIYRAVWTSYLFSTHTFKDNDTNPRVDQTLVVSVTAVSEIMIIGGLSCL